MRYTAVDFPAQLPSDISIIGSIVRAQKAVLWLSSGDTHIVIGGATETTRLALDALPRVFLDRYDHVGSEL